MSYSYLASPYSHPDARVRLRRYNETMFAVGWLLARRMWVYSPIVHCHQLAVNLSIPSDADYWWNYNKAMIDSADDLMILAIDGWSDSKGVRAEMDYADSIGKGLRVVRPRQDDSYKVET